MSQSRDELERAARAKLSRSLDISYGETVALLEALDEERADAVSSEAHRIEARDTLDVARNELATKLKELDEARRERDALLEAAKSLSALRDATTYAQVNEYWERLDAAIAKAEWTAP